MNSKNVNQFDFIRFALKAHVLSFGEFKTKAGRQSPYFFNAGAFSDGALLGALGKYYANALVESGVAFDMLYGPAYKGITLAATTAVALAGMGRPVPFCFNRKEAKDHGVTGRIAGALQPGDRVAIVEDTVTRGTSLFEAVEVVRAFGATPVFITVIVDRGGTCAEMARQAKISYQPMLTAPDLGYEFGS